LGLGSDQSTVFEDHDFAWQFRVEMVVFAHDLPVVAWSVRRI